MTILFLWLSVFTLGLALGALFPRAPRPRHPPDVVRVVIAGLTGPEALTLAAYTMAALDAGRLLNMGARCTVRSPLAASGLAWPDLTIN